MDWIIENASTIIASLVLVLIMGLIIFKLVRDKKSGKTSCGCGCGCGCHSHEDEKENK